MLKKILLALVAISLVLSFAEASESGIKFALNTKILNMLKKIDYSKKLTNKTLIGQKGITYEKKSFPSVVLNVFNLTVSRFENPTDVAINADNNDKSIEIVLKNITAECKFAFSLKVASIIKDSGMNSLVNINLDELRFVLKFEANRVAVKTLNFKLSKVDVNLNKTILNFILKLFKSNIVSKINASVEQIRSAIESSINNFISSQSLIDLAGMGIGVNATFTDKPAMDLFNVNTKEKIAEKFSFAKVFVDVIKDILSTEDNGKKNISLKLYFYCFLSYYILFLFF